MFPVDHTYCIDVAPLLVPKPANGASLWLGFEWQPSVGRWMAHCGRADVFRLVTSEVLKALVKQAKAEKLVIASFNAPVRKAAVKE